MREGEKRRREREREGGGKGGVPDLLAGRWGHREEVAWDPDLQAR